MHKNHFVWLSAYLGLRNSAYRQNYRTETALLNILNDACGNIDKGQSTLLVALDLSAAFDTVEHSVLLTRLENSFGVTGVASEWIASHLADRTPFVRVGSSGVTGVFGAQGQKQWSAPPSKVVTWVWRQQSICWSNIPLWLCQANNYPAVLWFSFNSMLIRKAVVGSL